MIRQQKSQILKDLQKKMVLLVGPRQSGKTFLAKDVATSFKNSLYLNFDDIKDRSIIVNQTWTHKNDLIIFDEIHKMEGWKNYVKGVFDTKPEGQSILVTGSARMDIFNRVGDSLAGRYFIHHLLPLSLSELTQAGEIADINKLSYHGGFPEPYFTENLIDANRWRKQYIDGLLSIDVFEFDNIYNLKAIRTVFELLRSKVGSPISYKSIAEDVGISSTTVKRYIQILEAIYVIFSVTPYSKNIARSLLKEPKIYFFDTGLILHNEGAQFENLVAVSLFKSISARNDYKAEECALHYLRNKDGQEVDFAITSNQNIEQAIEVKVSDDNISKSLKYFYTKYKIASTQIVKYLKREYIADGIEVLEANRFLSNLYL